MQTLSRSMGQRSTLKRLYFPSIARFQRAGISVINDSLMYFASQVECSLGSASALATPKKGAVGCL